MMKKAVSFEELKHCGKYVSFNKVDGVTAIENGKEIVMTIEEFEKYAREKMYEGGYRYRINYTLLDTESKVIAALDNKDTLRIYISKQRENNMTEYINEVINPDKPGSFMKDTS